ncbi:MAG: hypothetical protein ACLFN5_04125 [bacterium]
MYFNRWCKNRLILLFSVLALLLVCGVARPLSAQPASQRNSIYLAFNYPGVGLGWSGINHSVELKGYFDGTNWGFGPRFNYHWGHFDRGTFYLGFEYLNINFEGEISEGDGTMAGVVQGIELYFEDNTSLKLDVGPHQVSLEDDASMVAEEGWDVVLNIGLNIHF